MAFLTSSPLTIEYRSNMDRVACPVIFMATVSWTPLASRFLALGQQVPRGRPPEVVEQDIVNDADLRAAWHLLRVSQARLHERAMPGLLEIADRRAVAVEHVCSHYGLAVALERRGLFPALDDCQHLAVEVQRARPAIFR